MTNYANNCAVLLFALPARVDADRKPLSANPKRIWQLFHKITRTQIRASGLPLLESKQLITHQGTFGEQLSAAIDAVFQLGFEQVICVGNDCPTLLPADLRKAAHVLQNGQIPVGQDFRGGLYLFGLSKNGFNPDLFSKLAWQTSTLADDFLDFVAKQGHGSHSLTPKADIHTLADCQFNQLLGSMTRHLLQTIQALLVGTSPTPSVRKPLYLIPQFIASFTGRAPPSPCSIH